MMIIKELIKNLVYGTAEALTLGRGVTRQIGGEAIRFPARYSRYYPVGYEPELFHFLREHCRKGDVFFDCGAHFGLFSVVASRLVGPAGRVVSFEPSPTVRNILEKVIRLNQCRNVQVRPEAVSEKAGTATFYETGAEASNANSLAKQEKHSQGISVPITTVDAVAGELGLGVNCMKIDVEGAEYGLLVGAEHTIRAHRPTIFLSLHPAAITGAGASMKGIWRLLEDYKMKLSHLGKPASEKWFVEQTGLFDVVCLPG